MKLRREHALLLALVILSMLAGWEEFRPRERVTPAGQPPLLDLQSAEPVERAFNSAADSVRIIVLLSPT